jgi:hypothetical protein
LRSAEVCLEDFMESEKGDRHRIVSFEAGGVFGEPLGLFDASVRVGHDSSSVAQRLIHAEKPRALAVAASPARLPKTAPAMRPLPPG